MLNSTQSPFNRFHIKCPLVFGCAIEPMMAGQDCTELLENVYQCGINAFDTAEIYGQSEKVLGKWLKHKRREEIFAMEAV